MPEGFAMDDPQHAQNRKNSILVKDENSASKVNMNAAHPHFVENILPHRSPSSSEINVGAGNPAPAFASGTASAPPATSNYPGSSVSSMSSIPEVATTQERLNKLYVGGAPSRETSATPVGATLAQAQADAQNSQSSVYGTVHGATGAFAQPQGRSPFAPTASSAASFGSAGDISPSTKTTSPFGEDQPGAPGVAATSTSSGSQAPLSGRATSKQPSDPRIPMDDGKIHILLGVTGSLHVSSVKSIILKLQSIYGDRVAIQIIVTPAVEKIVASSSKEHPGNAHQAKDGTNSNAPGTNSATGNPTTGSAAAPSSATSPDANPSPPPATSGPTLKEKLSHHNIRVWHDSDEWDTWHGRNDPIIHIELRRWADILLIAPLSANTLGKIAMGLCDNLLTNVVRAWNSQYPILIAPAMVTYAYNHPATKRQLQLIREEMKWIEILRPTEKVVGSTGGIGMGGMMPWNEIVDRVVQKLGGYPDDDDDDDEEEDENDNPPSMNERREQANRSSTNGGDLDDDEDDEEDDDDDDNILTEMDHSHVEISPHGSPI